MKLPLALALILTALPGFADDAAAPANMQSGAAIQTSKAHPDLLLLEQDLTLKQNDKKEDRVTQEDYQAWETEFRELLAAALARVPPSPDNNATHARIMAMIGDRAQAQATLDQALKENPGSPVLLRTKGRLLYEQNDFPGAAQLGLQAWEKSGHTDLAAQELYQTSKDRHAPSGAVASLPADTLRISQEPAVVSAKGADKPYIFTVNGKAKPIEVPATETTPVSPTQSEGNGIGLLTTLGITAGFLMITWGAVPQNTKDHFKQVFWEQPKQEVKILAGAVAVTAALVGAFHIGVIVIPPLLAGTATTSPPAMTLALAGGGTAGGTTAATIAWEQALVGTVKAAILAAGAYIGVKKAGEHVSFSKPDQSKQGPGDSDAYSVAKNGGRHSGTVENYKGKSISEIQKAERSSLRQVELHRDKIRDPARYAEDWNQRSPKAKNDLLDYWKKDINRNQELADIMRGLLKERGL